MNTILAVIHIKVSVMSLRFDAVSARGGAEAAMEYLAEGGRCRVVTPNAEIAMSAERDEDLKNIINSSQIVLPDGVGVIKAAGILGVPLREKAAGIDFASELCGLMAGSGKRLFLYGAKPGVAEEAAKRLSLAHPGLDVCGTCDGYCGKEKALEAIRAAAPDVLYVCIGSPAQERFMAENPDLATVMAGLGGSLDIFAGVSKRAPKIFIDLGLEWFYRLLKEPKRIGRMMKLPLYILEAHKYKRKQGR